MTKEEKKQKAIERGEALLLPFGSTPADVASVKLDISMFKDVATAKSWARNHGIEPVSASTTAKQIVINARPPARGFEDGPAQIETVSKGIVVTLGKAITEPEPIDEPELDPVEKAILRNQTGVTNEHTHSATWDEDTGEGGTTVVDGHSHDIIDGMIQEADGHEHALTSDGAEIVEEVISRRKAIAKRGDIYIIKGQHEDDEEDPDEVVRIIGIVAKPEVPDFEGQIIKAETIVNANEGFMEDFATIGLMHKRAVDDEGVAIIQNVIAPVDFTFPETDKVIKAGTWYQQIKVTDRDLVAKIRNGEITGLSLGGFAQVKPVTEMIGKKLTVHIPRGMSVVEKRALQEYVSKAEGDPALEELVGLEVQEVSFVDAAANEEVFVIIKRRKPMTTNVDPKNKNAGAAPAAGIDPAASGSDPAATATSAVTAAVTQAAVVAPVVAAVDPVVAAVAPVVAAVAPVVAAVDPAAPVAAPALSAEQVAQAVQLGVAEGIKAGLAEVAKTAEPIVAAVAPVVAAAVAPVVAAVATATTDPDPVVQAIAGISEKLDNVTTELATVKAKAEEAVTVRAAAKGDSIVEGNPVPANGAKTEKLWAGTTVSSVVNRGKE